VKLIRRRTKINNIIRRVVRKTKRLSRKRVVRLGCQISVVILCLFFLGSNLFRGKALLSDIDISLSHIAYSWLLTTAAILLGALAWWLTLRGIGQHVDMVRSLRIHLLSNIAKYIPGYAWQLVGKAYLSKRIGISTNAVGVGMFMELAQLVLIGIIIAVSQVPQEIIAKLKESRIINNNSILWTILIIVVFLSLSIAIFAVLKSRNKYFSSITFLPFYLAGASISIFAGWLLFGFAFWMIGTSLQPLPLNDVPIFLFTLTASFLIGLAVIFVPGSLGVRESIMVLILSPVYVSGSLAVVIAVLSRLVIIISEFFSALLIVLLARLRSYCGYTEP
jgi:uncharacterized membrane protein YbhN (UPF0104 family)